MDDETNSGYKCKFSKTLNVTDSANQTDIVTAYQLILVGYTCQTLSSALVPQHWLAWLVEKKPENEA